MALPVYEMVINPEENSEVEVSFVALVDKPAIEKNFMAFNSHKLDFAINEEKRIISGPAMIADQLIYRKDENGEYNVFFSPSTVRDIALKFFKKDYQKNLNLFHDPALSLEGVTIFESFVSDASRGIQPMKGFEDLPDGSWLISAQVENDEVWNAIKSGQVKGFSVEGIFSFMKKSENRPNGSYSRFTERSFMNAILEQFKKYFGGELPSATPPAQAQQMGMDVVLKDGTPAKVDKLEAGGIITINDLPAPAGEIELQDGTKITIAEGGVIAAVTAASAAPVEQNADKPQDYSEQFKAYDERFTSWETKFNEHQQAYNTMASEFAETKKKLGELVTIVGKILETPTADSAVNTTGQFNQQAQDRQKKADDIINRIKNLK